MFYFLTDALGSVRDIVSGTDGAVLQSYEYTENGDKTASTSLKSDKTWIGGLSVNDDVGDSGLYLMGHRHYDPSTARFLSRDPIGFAGGLNLYSYGNSPVTTVDPEGLLVWPIPIPSPAAVGRAAARLARSPLPPQGKLAVVGLMAFTVAGLKATDAMGAYAASGAIAAAEADAAYLAAGQAARQALRTRVREEDPCPNNEFIYRDGRDWESRQRLETKAFEASVNVVGPQLWGVSASVVPSPNSSVAEREILERQGFKVIWTPEPWGKNHFTIMLPNPVTEEAATRFNQAFNRVKGRGGKGGMR
jgi:RHS repeat-associated protein